MTYLGLNSPHDYKIEKKIKIGLLQKKLFSKFYPKKYVFMRMQMLRINGTQSLSFVLAQRMRLSSALGHGNIGLDSM